MAILCMAMKVRIALSAAPEKTGPTYSDVSDSFAVAGGRDVIVDFTQGEDQIYLFMQFDFDFIGKADFSEQAGELRYVNEGANTIVMADVDGDAIEDFGIALNGHMTMTTDDFIL